MRAIRAICNKAIYEGYSEAEHYPFRRNVQEKEKYRIRKEKTSKRAVSKDFIVKIENYSFNMDNKMYVNAKNYFLFSFYMRGMNMVDLAKLKPENIVDDHLEYRRSKTGKSYKILLNEKAKAILDYYNLNKPKHHQYLFPIIKRPYRMELIKKDIENALSSTNKYLKRIAKDLGYVSLQLNLDRLV